VSTNKAPAPPSGITHPESAVSAGGDRLLRTAHAGTLDGVPMEISGPDSESVRNSLPPDAAVGGRYLIEERLGEGGMGRIFKVRHRDLGKLFALKIIHQNLAQQPHIRDAFYREARMAAAMSHPGIVSVIDFGVDAFHGAFIVMDYLEGETLAERLLRDELVEPKTACDILLQCAEALHYIHGLGVIHCDIKPENIFLCRSNTSSADEQRTVVRLLDFGLASRPAVDTKEIVAATTVAGTPTYLSPERIRAEAPTPASDIYAMGVLFYESLTGQPPFEGRLQDVLTGHLRRAPTPPSQLLEQRFGPASGRPPLPKNLESLVLRALAKEPAARHRSAAEFAFELRQVMQVFGVNRYLDSLGYVSSPRADLCEALVDACPLPMFVASPTGELLFGNAALGSLLGIAAPELRGKLSSTLLGRWCPRIERDVRMVLARRRASRHTLVVHSPQGEARGGWLTLAPYRRDGEVVGVCGVVAIMGDDGVG
jgi:tRNA A-37 threonylcarbamoyl transferase component Bud32